MQKQKYLKYTAVILLLTGILLGARGTYIHAKAELAWYLLRSAWQQTLEKGEKVRPWSWADTWPVARLMVPEHEVDLVVLEGDTGNVLAFGPGHMTLSPLPGQSGNSIISGHRDTSFSFLRDVREGEVIELQTADGRILTYRVTAVRVMDAAVLDMNIEADVPLLTLVTCYPFDAVVPGGPQRYLVFAEYDGQRRQAAQNYSAARNSDGKG